MTRSARLVAAGLTTFLIFLIAGIPAAVGIAWLAPESLRLSGVSGSLWRGSAAGADIGRLRLGETHWALSPFSLLLGRLAGDMNTKIGDGAASGSVAIGLSGTVRCTECQYEGPVAGLRTLVPAMRTLDGSINVEIAALEISDRWPVRVVGTARLSNVPIRVRGQSAGNSPVATFEATVGADPVPAGGLIEATVRDAGGPLELAARLSVRPPGDFEFSGRAKARHDAPAEVVNALAVLGPKGSDGSTELGISGSF
jgi:general secretion pathway protein N